jgi:hypothetical protein
MKKSPEEILRDLPDDWWQHASVAAELLHNWFRTFVVGLFISGKVGQKPEYYLFTGFLLESQNYLLWLTAGHVIDNISALLASPNFSLSFMRWLDGYETPGAEGVPINHTGLSMKSWRQEGLDLGAVRLPILEKYALMANEGASVMSEQAWRNLKAASPEGYYAIGFPRAWNDLKQTKAKGTQVLNSLKADLACLPIIEVQRTSDSPGDSFWDHNNSFYGKILRFPDQPALRIDNIVGMSGGPILSIERSPDAKIGIRLVGVQVEWLPSSEIVRAESIQEIAAALDAWNE